MNLFTDEIKTNPEAQARARAWIEALRSGNYQQAKGRLRTLEGFCCLGVACDLYDPSLWVSHQTYYSWVPVAGPLVMTTLNDDTRELYCLSSDIGAFVSADEKYTNTALTDLNDGGKSFAYIADVIERELNAALAA